MDNGRGFPGGEERSRRASYRTSEGGGDSVRVPHPDLFAPFLVAAVPAPQHRLPLAQPSGAGAGDVRTRARARSREDARIASTSVAARA